MRIAQVAPLYESVPPNGYGGTERVVHHLTEELVAMGHDVTLFASGDSETSARLVPMSRRALRGDEGCRDPFVHHLRMVHEIYDVALAFDLIHFHIDYLHLPVSQRQEVPNVTTLHGRLDLPDLVPMYRTFSAAPLVSISDAQRVPLGFANWIATVRHGLPLDLYPFRPRHDGYLLFLGRVSREKRLDRAIEIARRAGKRLVVAAKIDAADHAYYEREIRPLLAQGHVEFLGEVGEDRKGDLLGGAEALLFPIDWPEPFGLVMIEAMACGTPTIAYPHGSVPEVLEEGETGFLVRSIDQAVRAVAKLGAIDRAGCRARFERRFSARRMALDYTAVYERLVETDRALAVVH